MKVYKFVHVQMNEFPEGNVKQHSHDESKTNRTDGSKASVVRFVFESSWRPILQNHFMTFICTCSAVFRRQHLIKLSSFLYTRQEISV